MSLAFLQDFGPVGLLALGAGAAAALDLPALQRLGRGRARPLALLFLALAFLACVGFWHSSLGPAPPEVEHGGMVIDRFALFFWGLALAAAAAALLCGADAADELEPHPGVFAMLVLGATAGVLFTASAADLVSLLAGLALTSLPLSLALGLHKTSAASARWALRSLTVNGLALAAFAAGGAILAGLSGTTQLRQIPVGLHHVDPLLVLAAALLLLGTGAQLGLVPYLGLRVGEGSRLPVAALVASVLLGPLAAVAALLRLLPGALGAAPGSWVLLAQVLAALTLLGGGWLALRQRRLGGAVTCLLLAQLALVLGALPSGSQQAEASVLYLLLGWVPLAGAWFAVLVALGMRRGLDAQVGLRGLWGRSPRLALITVALLAGLAGVPPLAGFFGRWFVAAAALHGGGGWLLWLELLFAAVGMVVAWRWLLVILDDRVDGAELEASGRSPWLGLGLCGAAVLSFGILLGPLLALAARAALPPLVGP
ncbi:MAG: proton-conducting transporter membrane subunit [Candidatus Dormibacteria bacterium]